MPSDHTSPEPTLTQKGKVRLGEGRTFMKSHSKLEMHWAGRGSAWVLGWRVGRKVGCWAGPGGPGTGPAQDRHLPRPRPLLSSVAM